MEPDQNNNLQQPQTEQPAVETQPAPINPVTPPKPKTNLILLMSFLILVLLGTTGFLIFQNYQLKKAVAVPGPNPTNSTEPISDWQTYSNTDYQFELRLPTDWEVKHDTTGYIEQNVNVLENLSIAPSSLEGGSYANIEIRKDTVQSYIEYLLKAKEEGNNYYKEQGATSLITSFESQKEGTFANQKATILTFNIDNFKNQYYILTQGNNIYILSTLLGQDYSETTNQVLSTFKFVSNLIISPSVTPKPSNIKTLNYSKPTGWTTVANSSFELAYDSSVHNPTTNVENVIALNSLQCCFNVVVRLLPYSGGSRHEFIYKSTGVANKEQLGLTPNTVETEYLVSGKSGLFIYNVEYSSTIVVGMLDAGNGQAFYVASTGGDQVFFEKLLSSIKIL